MHLEYQTLDKCTASSNIKQFHYLSVLDNSIEALILGFVDCCSNLDPENWMFTAVASMATEVGCNIRLTAFAGVDLFDMVNKESKKSPFFVSAMK